MNSIYKILNDKYDKPLIARKEEKKKIAIIKKCLETHHIPHNGKKDIAIIQEEIVYRSIVVKQKFEEVFLDTYVKMYDYWNDLTYLERKQQMQVDMECLMEDLACFKSGDEVIYMPCFEPSFNHLYTNEIVLLDLKQYHTYIKEFAKEVRYNLYGALPFQHGFSSCEVVADTEDAYVLYHAGCNRLYRFQKDTFIRALSFYPKCKKEEENAAIIKQIASFMLLDDELQMLDCILASTLIKNNMKKKLQKYKKKIVKKKNAQTKA